MSRFQYKNAETQEQIQELPRKKIYSKHQLF